ncbi:MAG TPA: HAMP domain-containing sensor histidine kinase [Polyangiaceae bacterium]
MSGSAPISIHAPIARLSASPNKSGKPEMPRRILLVPIALSVVVGLITASLLALWFLVPSLKQFSSETMKANTAAGMCVASLSLWLLARSANGASNRAERWGRGLAMATLVLGAVTLIQYIFNWNLGIDELLVADFPNHESRLFPGRMSPITATCFCLLGAALLSLDAPPSKWGGRLATLFGLPLLFVNLIALTGYLYDVRNFYQLGPYIRIAWLTAACFSSLGLGALAARPDSGLVKYFTNSTMAGASSRRLLPAVVALPLAFGWAVLWAQANGYWDFALGTALFAVSLVVVLCYVVWRNTRALSAAERERERSAGLFRSFFSLGLVGMGQTDALTGRLLAVNSKLEEITGYSGEELAKLSIIDITHEADRDRDGRAMTEMLRGKRETYTTEKRYVHKDGRTVWALVNAAKVDDPSGAPQSAVAVIQDITFLKEAQDKLQEALRLREEFLIIASHELKTPLTALLMQVQGVRRLVARDPALVRYEQRLARAEASAVRLEKLIVHLLDVSRLTEGRLKLEPEPFDLAKMVDEVASRFVEAAEQVGSTIIVASGGPVEGNWDRMRVDQVLTNLLSNALKYGAGKPIEVTVHRSGDQAVVAVRDHGIGVAEGQQKRIFQRFERGPESESYGGFGLGLWIAMQIAEASGGTIDLDSEAGKGACFTLRLPIAAG